MEVYLKIEKYVDHGHMGCMCWKYEALYCNFEFSRTDITV